MKLKYFHYARKSQTDPALSCHQTDKSHCIMTVNLSLVRVVLVGWWGQFAARWSGSSQQSESSRLLETVGCWRVCSQLILELTHTDSNVDCSVPATFLRHLLFPDPNFHSFLSDSYCLEGGHYFSSLVCWSWGGDHSGQVLLYRHLQITLSQAYFFHLCKPCTIVLVSVFDCFVLWFQWMAWN